MELVNRIVRLLLVLSITDCLWKLNQGTAPHAWPHPKKILQVRELVVSKCDHFYSLYIFLFFSWGLTYSTCTVWAFTDSKLLNGSLCNRRHPSLFPQASVMLSHLNALAEWGHWPLMLELMKGFEGPRGARPLWLIERAKGTGMASNVGWENKQHIMALNGSLVIST